MKGGTRDWSRVEFTLGVHFNTSNSSRSSFSNYFRRYGRVILTMLADISHIARRLKTYMKVEGHKIVDVWVNGLKLGPNRECVSNSCNRRLKVGLYLVSVGHKTQSIWVPTITTQVSTPPLWSSGTTNSISLPCRRWTCISAEAGSSKRSSPFRRMILV